MYVLLSVVLSLCIEFVRYVFVGMCLFRPFAMCIFAYVYMSLFIYLFRDLCIMTLFI